MENICKKIIQSFEVYSIRNTLKRSFCLFYTMIWVCYYFMFFVILFAFPEITALKEQMDSFFIVYSYRNFGLLSQVD